MGQFSLRWTGGACVASNMKLLAAFAIDGIVREANMVYYFTSNTVSPDAFIYVGKDKVESKS